MTTLFLSAHYDDEFGAWPLIAKARRDGEAMVFAYTAPPREPGLRARRLAETQAFLASLEVGPEALLTFETPAAFDGEMLDRALAAFEQIAGALDRSPPDRIVAVAWEGGHSDHDLTAAVALALAQRWALTEPVRQFPLYTGEGLPGPLFHGARILAGSGPTQSLTLSAAEWRDYAASVRHFPSQAGVWSTLWPLMFASFASGGYRTQELKPERIGKRPHTGPLLYERRGKARFDEVAAVAASLLAASRPAAADAGDRRP
jgi:hypothetical protein